LGKTTIRMINAVGQTVLAREALELNSEVLQLDGWQAGYYILLISSGPDTFRKEVVVVN